MPKLKLIDVHPVKTWVLVVNENDRIGIWDYEQSTIILDTTSSVFLF